MYRSIFPLDKVVKKSLTWLIILNLISTGLSLIFPLSVRILIDDLIPVGNKQHMIIWIVLSLMLALFIFAFDFYYISYTGDKTNTILSNKLREKLIQKMLSIPVCDYNKLDRNMLFNAIVGETNMASTVFINDRVIFWVQIIQSVLYVGVILFLNFKIGILTVVAIPFFIFLSAKNQDSLHKTVKDERLKVDSVVGMFRIISEHKKQIMLYGKNDYFENKFMKKLIDWGEARIKFNFYYTLLKSLPTLLNKGTIILVYGIGAFLVVNKSVSLGELILISQLCISLFEQLTGIVQVKIDVKNSLPIFERIDKIMFFESTPNKILEVHRGKSFHLQNIEVNIEGKELFKIPNFSISENGITKINAENGTGKTVFLEGLLNLNHSIHAENGNITVPEASDIGYFSNSSFFFEGSTLENIFLSDKTDEDFLSEIQSIFNFDELDKTITLNPLNLSLGQQQKLSLLRFFYLHKDKNYLIIDEPTSNLDLDSIHNLKNFLRNLSESKKIILISHDHYFDDIITESYVIKNGILKKM